MFLLLSCPNLLLCIIILSRSVDDAFGFFSVTGNRKARSSIFLAGYRGIKI